MKHILKPFLSLLLLLALSCYTESVFAQMPVGQDTLYGNEWINYTQQYYKFQANKRGVMQITYAQLVASGVPVSTVNGTDFEVFYMGRQLPIYVTATGPLGSNDYIELYVKNDPAEIDRFLMRDTLQNWLNPFASLFTRKAPHFLTWSNTGQHLRFTPLTDGVQGTANLPVKEPYYIHEAGFENVLSSGHPSAGTGDAIIYSRTFADGRALSDYSKAGYGIHDGGTNEATYTFNTNNVATNASGAPDARLDVMSRADIKRTHLPYLFFNADTVYKDSPYNDLDQRKYSFPIPLAHLKGNNNDVMKLKGMATPNDGYDWIWVAYTKLFYPRFFNFENKDYYEFTVAADAINPKYIEITNFNAGTAGAPVLYDLDNGLRISTLVQAGVVKFALPPSPVARRLVLRKASVFLAPYQSVYEQGVKPALTAVSFTNFANTTNQGNYLILTHKKLRNDGNGSDWVQAYSNYRASADGGGYVPVVVTMQQLYDQFAYGVATHPMAVRNFTHLASRRWQGVNAPRQVFLVGSAAPLWQEYDAADDDHTFSFVPSWCFPMSDNRLVGSFRSSRPDIPVGRLAAVTGSDVKNYLEKVRQYEANFKLPQTQTAQLWKKNVMHFQGGNDVAALPRYMDTLRSIIARPKFGANVLDFVKHNSDPVNPITSAYIDSIINSGVSLITIFGHAAANSFDVSIDQPYNWRNPNRYPVMMSLGCLSGSIQYKDLGFYGIGDEFVNIAQKGAIGFIAATSYEEADALNQFADAFYKRLGGTHYARTLGELMQAAIADNPNSPNPIANINTVNDQILLHGDPALRFNIAPAPDLIVRDNSITFTPDLLTTQIDSFNLCFDVLNIGAATNDSMVVQITRTYNSTTLLPLSRKVRTPTLQGTFCFRMATGGADAVGSSNFQVCVDALNTIVEKPTPDAENNNCASAVRFVVSDQIIPIYPPDYGIIGGNTPAVTLKATTTNTFGAPNNYKFEIDTVRTFSSAWRKSTVVPQFSGGIPEWTPPVTLSDSTVYYWRVKLFNNTITDTLWRYSSFVYLKNAPTGGWNQSHYYQFTDDRRAALQITNATKHHFSFNNTAYQLNLKYNLQGSDQQVKLYTNDEGVNKIVAHDYDAGYTASACLPSGSVIVCAFDPVTALPLINPPGGKYGSQNCSGTPSLGFIFRVDSTVGRERVRDFVKNIVPNGYYILAFTTHDYNAIDWKADSAAATVGGYQTLFGYFRTQGAKQTYYIPAKKGPYAFFYRKNTPTFVPQEMLKDLTESVDVTFSIPRTGKEGSIQSTVIGPARAWKGLKWNTYALEPADTATVRIYGIDNNRQETLLVRGIRSRDTSIAGINAAIYPYLRLQYGTRDVVNRTATTLVYWRTLFDPIPEAAIRPEKIATANILPKANIDRGEPLTVRIPFENISQADMQPIRARFSLLKAGSAPVVDTVTFKALKHGDTLMLAHTFDTRQLIGKYTLQIDANPEDAKHQTEQYHYNNVWQHDVYSRQDNTNPNLDVVFDGVHILDGDLVSAKPSITVNLKDENKYLPLNRAEMFQVFLVYPKGMPDPNNETLVQLVNGTDFQFFPADSTNLTKSNRARIELKPTFAKDGKYGLLVQANDYAGNLSGLLKYKVYFKVENKATITNVLNYPNPFTTSTRFVFQLTGSEVPAAMRIEIFNINGVVVREITQAELGNIHIGNNRTEFAWDGTDQYGDRLANGVYLYHVTARKADGSDYELQANSTDQYFKGGFGKMYLMR